MAVDLPHHGTAAPNTPAHAPATLAAFAAAVVRAVERALRDHGAEQVVLVGHSLGAAVCVEAARALGPRADHVIALDALLNPRVYPRQSPAVVAFSRVASRLLHPVMARLLARALLPAPRDAALMDDVVQGLLRLPAHIAAEASADLAAWDRDAALRACTARMTLMPAARFFRADVYAALSPHCALAGPVDGSHFFLRERPNETAALLRVILSAPNASARASLP